MTGNKKSVYEVRRSNKCKSKKKFFTNKLRRSKPNPIFKYITGNKKVKKLLEYTKLD